MARRGGHPGAAVVRRAFGPVTIVRPPRPRRRVRDGEPGDERAIERVVVVVPARDEASLLGACLESIDAAALAWGGPVSVLVGADRCADGTAAVGRSVRARGAHLVVVEGRWGRASRVRRALTDRALEEVDRVPGTWIASTDADGVVPTGWLRRQVDQADRGADLVLGVVRLPADAPTTLHDRFARAYGHGPTHHHVHAANLGLRASSYLRLGGWDRRVVVGEDHQLAQDAGAAGLRIVRDPELVVTTSHRRSGRVRGGFADVLAGLDELGPAVLPR